jgi:hypothetical protein
VSALYQHRNQTASHVTCAAGDENGVGVCWHRHFLYAINESPDCGPA